LTVHCPLVDKPTTEQDRRRRERLTERLFTGLNMAVFVVLISCVVAAAVLWERWH